MSDPQRSSHPIAVAIALVLAVLVGVVAIASVWANQQLLDTGSWVSVSDEMLESKDVRHRVATFLGDELADGTEAQLSAAGAGEVAAEVMPRLRAESTGLAERVMQTRRFDVIWREANRSGHRTLVRALDGGGDGAVVVNLTPALRQVAAVLGEEGLARELGVSDLSSFVEPGAARIEVLEAAELSDAQDVVRLVRDLTAPAVIALIVLYDFVLLLGRRRLARTFLWIGLAFAATGGLALVVRALAGDAIVDQLLGGTAAANRDAADAAWGIATSKVADLAGLAIGLGAAVVLLVAAFAVFRKATEQRTMV